MFINVFQSSTQDRPIIIVITNNNLGKFYRIIMMLSFIGIGY